MNSNVPTMVLGCKLETPFEDRYSFSNSRSISPYLGMYELEIKINASVLSSAALIVASIISFVGLLADEVPTFTSSSSTSPVSTPIAPYSDRIMSTCCVNFKLYFARVMSFVCLKAPGAVFSFHRDSGLYLFDSTSNVKSLIIKMTSIRVPSSMLCSQLFCAYNFCLNSGAMSMSISDFPSALFDSRVSSLS